MPTYNRRDPNSFYTADIEAFYANEPSLELCRECLTYMILTYKRRGFEQSMDDMNFLARYIIKLETDAKEKEKADHSPT
jgi:hypothetical protein